MQNLVNILLRGLAVGVFVSAPMGPVGILCIQRTLDKGRRTGLFTGIGAAASDLIYCLLTGFGLAFIEEFLEKNQNIIQLIGSAVLIGFAIYLFRKNPSAGLKKPDVQPGSPGKDILGGFLFTFSNPLILFLIIGLFARFNFLAPENKFYHYIVGYIAIIAGALGWWWLVTYFVDKLRAHFNVRSMWLINRFIGVLILIFAVVGILTSVGSMTGWAARPNAVQLHYSGESITEPEKQEIKVVKPDEIYFRTMTGKEYSGWGFRLESPSGEGFELAVLPEYLRDVDPDPLIASQSPTLPEHHIKITDLSDGELLLDRMAPDGFDLRGGVNAYHFQRKGDVWELWGGNREPVMIGSFRIKEFSPSAVVVYPEPGGELKVTVMRLRGKHLPEVATAGNDTVRNKGLDLAGKWGMYDYDIDKSKLSIGGDYRLECVETPAGYELRYLSGARIYPGQWESGQEKAYLIMGDYPDIYRVEWIDPMGEVIEGGTASIDADAEYITIQFPSRNSKVRLRRI